MKIRNGYVGNSSSSCFICNTDLNILQIESLLKSMLEMWNNIQQLKGLPTKTYDDMFIGPFPGNKETDKHLNNFFEHNTFFTETCTIIESASDNSIPYELFELIEYTFDAHRHHLG